MQGLNEVGYDHAVVIAGGGPTGLMLAGELALAGVDVVIVERRPDQSLAGSRAGGLHARTLEVLDQRGLVERFLAEGQKAQTTGFAGVRLDLAGFATRHPYGLGLWQNHIERLLAGWVEALRVPVYRQSEVTGFAQDEAGVEVRLNDGRVLRAKYLVGCDGGRSTVRKAAGIDFPGWDPTVSCLIAEVEMAETPPLGVRQTAAGINGISRVEYEIRDGEIVYGDTGPMRVMITEAGIGEGEPTLEMLRAGLVAVYGTDYGVHSPTWLSRFSDMSRQAASYRAGRVLLAGDAAHIHAPDGGFGLNTGVQDAVNLGWKLAQVVRGLSPERLLDSYHAERHPVGAAVVRTTMASVALRRQDDRTGALRETIAGLLEAEPARTALAAKLSGLAIHYDLGEGHPLRGRRMPDLDLVTAGGEVRVFSFLHGARGVLIRFGGIWDIGRWSDRVQTVDAGYDGIWQLPGLGDVTAPPAVLVRPDGYVAWAGEGGQEGVEAALTRWFGPAVWG